MARPTDIERERRRLLKEQGKWPETPKKPVGRPKTKAEEAIKQPAKAGEISIKDLEQEIQNDTRSVNPVSEECNYSEDDVVVEDFNEPASTTGNDNGLIKETYYEEIEVPDDVPSANKTNEPDLGDINDDVPQGDFDPLDEPVKERDYTNKGANTQQAGTTDVNGNTTPIVEEQIPEPKINYDNIEDDFEKDKKKDGGGKSTGTGAPVSKEPKREPVNQKLDDLSPAKKRQAAEKSADAILLTYKNIAPVPFKWMANFNIPKLERLDAEGEIQLSQVLTEDGTTVKQYVEHVNAQVEEIFVITNEMTNDIKEPLVDVLMENNLALTPTQRLVMAVGQQVLQMGITSAKMLYDNKQAIKFFKESAKDNRLVKEEIIREHEAKKSKAEKELEQERIRAEQHRKAQAKKEEPKKQTKVEDDIIFNPPPSDFDDDTNDDIPEPNPDPTPKKPTPTVAVVVEKTETKKEAVADNKLEAKRQNCDYIYTDKQITKI